MRVQKVKDAYRLLASDARTPFSEILDELRESFVRQISEKAVDWMHPSIRDLIIEELSLDVQLQRNFLQSAGVSGIKLAVSDWGGPSGERSLPLISSQANWILLEERCLKLVPNAPLSQALELIESLASAISEVRRTPQDQAQLSSILRKTWECLLSRIDTKKEALSSRQLQVLSGASTKLEPLPALPNINPSWEEAISRLKRILRKYRIEAYVEDYYELIDFFEFVQVIMNSEPRFLTQVKFPGSLQRETTQVLEIVEMESDADWVPANDTADAYSALAELCREVQQLTELLRELKLLDSDKAQSYLASLSMKEEDFEAESAKREGPEPDYDDDYRVGSGSGVFDVDKLFKDL